MNSSKLLQPPVLRRPHLAQIAPPVNFALLGDQPMKICLRNIAIGLV